MTFYNRNIYTEHLNTIHSFEAVLDRITDSTHYMDTTANYLQVMDSTAETIYLPDATNFGIGHLYYMANDTTRLINLMNNDGTRIVQFGANSRSVVALEDNTTSAGRWLYESSASSTFASYSIYGSYGGNANTGRYMEIYPGTDSEESPYIVVTPLAIVAITLGTSALNTATMGIFKTTDLVNPITSITLNNEDRKVVTGIFVQLDQSDEIAMRVTSGRMNKPYITLYFTGT